MSMLAPLLLATAPAAIPTSQDDELFSFWIADLETFFSDPRDAGLLEALRLIDDRVLELPAELPEFAMPPELIELGLHMLSGEKSLRVMGSSDQSMMLPVYGQLEMMEGDPQKAADVASAIIGVAQMMGVPMGVPQSDGLTPIEELPMEAHFGTRGDEVFLSVGKVIDAPIDLSDTGLPSGVAPTMRMSMDAGAMFEMLAMFVGGADPEMDMTMDMLDEMGMTDLEMHMATGVDAERSYTAVRMPRYASHLAASDLLPTRTLSKADLGMIPKDAVWAGAYTYNFQGYVENMLMMMEEPMAMAGVGDPVEMIAGMTGFHLQADFIDHLGDAMGMYTSDTTGGGDLLSMAAFVELKNSDGMHDTLGRLQDLVNEMAEVEADGYVEMRSWEDQGTAYMSLTFPGMPIPADPTLAFTDSHLIMGLTAATCMAAVEQSKGGSGSILDHPRFLENLPSAVEDAYAITFLDTPRMLKDGYGMMNLACSALTNGTRSRVDSARSAGVIMPPYHELMRGAKASVSVSRVDGRDYVTEGRGDRSMLVNMTGMVGLVMGNPLLMAIPGAVLFESASSESSMAFDESDWEIEAFPDLPGDDDEDF